MASPLDDSMRRLHEYASKLNEATENLNEKLSEIEERFRQTKLGLDFWLDDALIPADPLHEPGGDRLPAWEGPGHEDYFREGESFFTVGWGKLGETWRLLVRRWEPAPDDGFNCWNNGQVQPVGNAPRHVRIAALSMAPRIAEALAAEAKRCIEMIERATGDLERSNKEASVEPVDDDVPF